MINGEITS